ncbi:MAG: hypothetical protein IJS08_08070 [Victivallales bacterium]|nr:hypothetical protein [Victivallales bacterium]
MNMLFIGGGSLRILPLLRGAFEQASAVFRNGEIRLVDLQLKRAEAVGRMLLACPEYANVGCRVVWTDELEGALPNTDVVYLTMGARRSPSNEQSVFLANKYGFCSTDNLSISGAFLSLRLGRTILGIARKMEKYCPKALMLIFPNPVAVYSHLVNTFTKIRALGICGGFNNHRYDLTRLIGRDEFDPGWNVVAAGVNHLSFILRGDYHGKDLYSEILPRYLNAEWKPLKIAASSEIIQRGVTEALSFMYRMFHRYGTIIFSSEFDGSAHVFPDEALELQIARNGMGENFEPEAAEKQFDLEVKERFERFIAMSKQTEKVDWNNSDDLLSKVTSDIAIPIFKALFCKEKMRIVASRPNCGAVRDFADNVPLEYTMDISGAEITPVENQYIPSPFKGVIASLAEFQRLQSEAIVKWEPRIFADALEAYPVGQFSRKRNEFYRKMFDIYSDVDSHMLQARQFFE